MKCFFVFVVLTLLGFAASDDSHKPGVVDKSVRHTELYKATEKSLKHNRVSTGGNLDLGTLLTEWGNTWCQNGGTSMADCSTGPWSSDPNPHCGPRTGENTWCSYQDYGYPCMGYDCGAKSIIYGNALQAPATPFIFDQWFDNGANTTDYSIFTHSEDVANSYSVTMSESISASWSMSITAGLPDICQVNDDFSLNISLTRTSTQTSYHSKSWSVSEKITVPPMSTIHAMMYITKTTFSAPFTADVHFDGVGSVWCNGKVQNHWLWFPAPQDLLTNVPNTTCTFAADASADCMLSGLFVGLQGVSVNVNVTQCPLNTRC